MNRWVIPGALGTYLSMLLMSAGVIAAEGGVPGKDVYEKWCAGCHADSPFAPGTIYLRQNRPPELAVIEGRTDLSAEFIRVLVRRGQGGMPSFRKTEISDTELQSLVDYLAPPK